MIKQLRYILLAVVLITAFLPIRVEASTDVPDFLHGIDRGLPLINTSAEPFSSVLGLPGDFDYRLEKVDVLKNLTPETIKLNGSLLSITTEEQGTNLLHNVTLDGQIITTFQWNTSYFAINESVGFGLFDRPIGSFNGGRRELVMLINIISFFQQPMGPAINIYHHRVSWVFTNIFITDDDEITIPSDNGDDSGWSFESILDFIIHIFIPREDFFEYQFDRLDGRLRDKLPFQTYIDTIGRLREVSEALDGDYTVFDITYELQGQQFQLDIGRHIAPHLPQIRTLITGLYIIFIAYYNYRQVMFMIRGRNAQSQSGVTFYEVDV